MKDVLHLLEKYLVSSGWVSKICINCDQNYLSSIAVSSTRCSACGVDMVPTDVPTKSSEELVSWEKLWHATHRVLVDHNKEFSLIPAHSIMLDGKGGTKFICAGLQVLEPSIFHGVPFQDTPVVVAQPVIRMNYRNRVAYPGYSTSFVNICSEQINANLSAHINHLDFWLTCLNTIDPNAEFEIRLIQKAWDRGGFVGTQLQMYMNHIEIGDAIYITHSREEAIPLLPIADWSFGLERILSAVNRTNSYINYIFSYRKDHVLTADDIEFLDSLRTSTLMILGGVTPSARRHGRVLRNMLKSLLSSNLINHEHEVKKITRHFTTYWLTFLKESSKDLSWQDVYGIIISEICRVAQLHKINFPSSKSNVE